MSQLRWSEFETYPFLLGCFGRSVGYWLKAQVSYIKFSQKGKNRLSSPQVVCTREILDTDVFVEGRRERRIKGGLPT